MLVPSCDLSGRFETIASRVMSQPGSPGSAAQRWGSSPQHQERVLRGDNNGEDGMGTDSTCKQSDPQHPRFLGSSESAVEYVERLLGGILLLHRRLFHSLSDTLTYIGCIQYIRRGIFGQAGR